MSTLKVDTVQGSTGNTVTVPAGHVMHFSEQPTGTGFNSAVSSAVGSGAATTSDTSSTSVVVDIHHTIARNAGSVAVPDLSPYSAVATRMTFTNGILTNVEGGIGRFLKYINRTYASSVFGITATGPQHVGPDIDTFDFGNFYITSFNNNGKDAWVRLLDATQADGTTGVKVNGVTKTLHGSDANGSDVGWVYTSGSNDAAQQGVWMYQAAVGWFFWSAATVVQPASGRTGGIWVWVDTKIGQTPIGWCFWKSEASTTTGDGTTGGVGAWMYGLSAQKWVAINDESTPLTTSLSAAGTGTEGENVDTGTAPTTTDVPTGERSDTPPASGF